VYETIEEFIKGERLNPNLISSDYARKKWIEYQKENKPAGKYHSTTKPETRHKKKKSKQLTHTKVFDTPLIPLEVGITQTNGPLWYILNTRKVGTIKLWIAMFSAAITSPMGHPVARRAYMKHIPEGNVPVWMPYKEGMKRCNIGSKSTFQDARDELVGLGLIERTDDNSIYIIGRITGDNEWKSLLHLRCDAMMEGTDIEENGYRVST
jgi:hypothetical protein